MKLAPEERSSAALAYSSDIQRSAHSVVATFKSAKVKRTVLPFVLEIITLFVVEVPRFDWIMR